MLGEEQYTVDTTQAANADEGRDAQLDPQKQPAIEIETKDSELTPAQSQANGGSTPPPVAGSNTGQTRDDRTTPVPEPEPAAVPTNDNENREAATQLNSASVLSNPSDQKTPPPASVTTKPPKTHKTKSTSGGPKSRELGQSKEDKRLAPHTSSVYSILNQSSSRQPESSSNAKRINPQGAGKAIDANVSLFNEQQNPQDQNPQPFGQGYKIPSNKIDSVTEQQDTKKASKDGSSDSTPAPNQQHRDFAGSGGTFSDQETLHNTAQNEETIFTVDGLQSGSGSDTDSDANATVKTAKINVIPGGGPGRPLVLGGLAVAGVLIVAAGALCFVYAMPIIAVATMAAYVGFIAMMVFGGTLTVSSVGAYMHNSGLCCYGGRKREKLKRSDDTQPLILTEESPSVNNAR